MHNKMSQLNSQNLSSVVTPMPSGSVNSAPPPPPVPAEEQLADEPEAIETT